MSYGTTLYRHKATLTAYLGDSGLGEIYDTDNPETIRCRFQAERKVLRSSRGDEVVADAMLECRPNEGIAEKDKISINGRNYVVAEIRPAEGPHTRTNHLEVWLRAD